MAEPFSMAPDFSWVDEGNDPVQAAAEAAAGRTRNAVRSHYGRPEGKATAVLDSLGTGVYNSVARPARIWGALNAMQPGEALSDHPEIVDQGAALSLDLLGAPAMTPGGIVKGAAGIFGGRLAQTADTAALKRAEEMAGKGAGKDAIWNETGWFQGRDGQWRFEIPDAGSTFNAEKMLPKQYRIFGNLVPGREGVAGEVMSHPEFFAAYPDAARMSVGQTNYGGGNRGTYHPPGMIAEQIGLDASLLDGPARQMIPDGARGVMLHEMQHRTQQAEGFARGGDPKTIGSVPNPDIPLFREALKNDPELQRYLKIHKSPEYQAEIDAQNKTWVGEYQPKLDAIYAKGKDYIPGEADQVFADFNKLKAGKYPLDEETEGLFKSLRARGVPLREPSDPMLSGSDLYSRLAGEVEARNVQHRMNLTPEERRAKPPWATEDTRADRQVVFDRDGPVVGPADVPMSMAPKIKETPGLAMDDESRLARARQLGYNVDERVYHETAKPFDEFKPAYGTQTWFTTDPKTLGSNAAAATGHTFEGYLKNMKLAGWPEYEKYGTDQLMAMGYGGARLDKDIVTFDPKKVRSVDARFDPANEGTGFLLGANAGDKKTGAAIAGADLARENAPMSMAPAKSYPMADRSRWYGDANYQQTGGRLTEMTPDEFLAKARPMKIDDVARENIDDLKRHIQSGGELDPLALYKNGKEDGRHRAIAAKELGIKKLPVLRWND